MLTDVGILTLISMINFMFRWVEREKSLMLDSVIIRVQNIIRFFLISLNDH